MEEKEEVKNTTSADLTEEEIKEEIQPEQKEGSVVNTTNQTKKKNSKVGIVIAIICVVVFILLIAGFVYIKYSRGNKKIISTGITNLTSKFEEIAIRNEDLELTKNYTIDGTIELDLESDLLDSYAKAYDEYKPYTKLIDNLNKTSNSFSLKQNLDSKKMLYQIDSKLNNDQLIDAKFYIEEDKEYYFVKGFLDKYIESGESSYFENLEENQNTYDNIEYLYKFLIDSLKNNLKDEYFVKTNQVITIDGEKINTKKITLKLDENNGNELLENILKDLKADKKANEILTSLDEDFEDAEVEDAIEEGQEITFSVYVDNLFYHIQKYELTVDDSYEEVLITYVDQEKDIIEIYSDKELASSIEITNEDDNSYVINIFDEEHEKLANISLKNTKTSSEMSFDIDVDDYVVKGKVTSKYSNIIKNKSYDNKTIISVNVKADKQEMADAKITIDMTAKNNSDIDEDVSDSMKQDDITTSQKEALQDIYTNAFIKLMQ